MNSEQEYLPTPESIAKYVRQNAQKQAKSPSMKNMIHAKGGQEIIRQDDYKGHHVVVRTRYDITIDGQVVTGHIMLTNLGQVQYHGLPNHSFDSAVEMARALIDNFPEDFEKRATARSSHDGRSGGSIGRMKMTGTKTAKSSKPKSRRSNRKSK